MAKGATTDNRKLAAKAIRQEIYGLIRSLKALGQPIGITLGSGSGNKGGKKRGPKPKAAKD